MNKSDLIDAIAAGADISKASAGRALDSAIGAITGALPSGSARSGQNILGRVYRKSHRQKICSDESGRSQG